MSGPGGNVPVYLPTVLSSVTRASDCPVSSSSLNRYPALIAAEVRSSLNRYPALIVAEVRQAVASKDPIEETTLDRISHTELEDSAEAGKDHSPLPPPSWTCAQRTRSVQRQITFFSRTLFGSLEVSDVEEGFDDMLAARSTGG